MGANVISDLARALAGSMNCDFGMVMCDVCVVCVSLGNCIFRQNEQNGQNEEELSE